MGPGYEDPIKDLRVWRGYTSKYRGTYKGLYCPSHVDLPWERIDKKHHKNCYKKVGGRRVKLPGMDPYDILYERWER